MIRDAKLKDVPAMRDLISSHAELDRMIFRSLPELYESLRNFKVYEQNGQIVGCCALQVFWADLAEVKSLAVHTDHQGQGIGAELLRAIIEQAGILGLPKIFTLTLEEQFFAKMGFVTVSKDALPMKVWSDCVNCSKQDNCDEIAMMFEVG